MSALTELVSVRTRYRRAVNLSADSRDSSAVEDILVTPLVINTLDRLLTNLENPDGERSFMLYGPYGSGKSTFSLFLHDLFRKGANEKSKTYAALGQANPILRDRFADICKIVHPWLCISLTARRSPIGQIILEGLQSTIADLHSGHALSRKIEASLSNEGWRDSGAVLELVDEVRTLVRNRGGLLLIIDEAGKCLEYALQDKAGDVQLFQMLAEYAKRCKDIDMLFMTVQHQHFNSYTELSDTTLRNEWAKVQQRFEPLPFNDQLSSGITTLGQVFEYAEPLSAKRLGEIRTACEGLCRAGAILPHGMSEEDFTDICEHAWPLHPSVVLTLPLLFQLLAQNGRSLFTYLTSLEPCGLQDFCRSHSAEDGIFVRLHDIAEYLLINMTATLALRSSARLLLELQGQEYSCLTEEQRQCLSTVALLNVLDKNSPLKATDDVLRLSLSPACAVPAIIDSLRSRQYVTFRTFDRTYRLWEGGNIDLEDLMQNARMQVRCEGTDFIELLRSYVSMRPLVARRHSLESGAYRFFEVEYIASMRDMSSPPKQRASCDAGRVAILLPMNAHELLEEEAVEATRRDHSLVVAIPRQLDMLRQPAIELACLRLVEKQTPALRGDRRAMREFGTLLAECERRLKANADLLLDPRPAPQGNACQWFWNGEQQRTNTTADVTRLLSRICDANYDKAPRIRNELVARPVLSAQATGARNILLKNMLTCAEQEHLGIDGYPAERSMYESVLHETGLHRCDASGHWHLCAPMEGSRLLPVWQAMEQEIFGVAGERVPLTQLFNKLAQPPYGVPEGLLPIFLLALYLCNTRELFLYREGSFLTAVDEPTVELLQRRPDLFGISGVRLEGVRKAVVERYAKGMHVDATVPAVVSRLYAAIRQLPPLAQNTSRLNPKRGKALLDCCRAARSPERLLFDDLPRAFGLPSLLSNSAVEMAGAFGDAMRDSMMELVDFAPRTRIKCRDELLEVCGLPVGAAGWHSFVERAQFLVRRVHRGPVVPVLERVCRAESSEDSRLEGALGVVYGRPFRSWSDADVDAFAKQALGMGEQFQRVWQDYGSAFLSGAEQKNKEMIISKLSDTLKPLQSRYSSRAVAEALRELLREVDSRREEQ